ncbi:hypothetical protein [Pelagibacterium lentulum]|uniref:Uncharacterized protein n=1 Tax=Pelagibacterium lentulum TaxID=2029865 RepID=A0A916VWN9_9HYPH|nr:hypothetical protein [Pelagibacterium lentulum]GGA45912.1 hypothetical protein GCM10011499_14570 [Pelagibacterium lentulum]
MKAKTINKVIRAKVDEWLSSIEDEAVRDLAKKNTIVTGGCIASMLLREPVNDYDLYFTNKETALAVAEYYVARFKSKNASGIEVPISVDDRDGRIRIVVKSAGIASEDGATTPYEYFEARPDAEASEYVGEVLGDAGDIEEALEETTDAALAVDDGKPKYRPVFLSTNAITLSHKVQIVLRFYGDADTIHENYDYVHCTNYWTSKDSELTLRQPALESLLARELRYVGSKYPICSVIRLRKFIKRNWTINAGQILKMMLQISELNLKDHAVLQDQLTGVDAAYFVQLVSKIKEKDPEKVNSAYLVEIIDRMF